MHNPIAIPRCPGTQEPIVIQVPAESILVEETVNDKGHKSVRTTFAAPRPFYRDLDGVFRWGHEPPWITAEKKIRREDYGLPTTQEIADETLGEEED